MSVLPTMTLTAVQVTALNSYPSEFQANLIPFNKQQTKRQGTAWLFGDILGHVENFPFFHTSPFFHAMPS